ncbi:MAG: hypothetical protein AAF634_16340 [Bacteroidota bacterium]
MKKQTSTTKERSIAAFRRRNGGAILPSEMLSAINGGEQIARARTRTRVS